MLPLMNADRLKLENQFDRRCTPINADGFEFMYLIFEAFIRVHLRLSAVNVILILFAFICGQ